MLTNDSAISGLTQNGLSTSQASAQYVPQIEVTYYTDPLCSWSWALEPQLRRLRYEFDNQLTWRTRMGGLISDWQHFNDPINDISRPAQMPPQWIQIRYLCGMPIDERIWLEDPPGSSYPACIAVKAAQRQGLYIGEAYLRRLREAVMLERRNIARQEVLLSLADEVAESLHSFDLEQFHYDFDNQDVQEAFREDIKEARYRNIERFPALILRPITGRNILIVGYRPYQTFSKAIAYIAPQCHPVRSANDIISYTSYWRRVTALEVAVALNLEIEPTTRMLKDAVKSGTLSQSGQVYLSLDSK